MLNDYKKLYKDCADLIPNWTKMTKSELAQKYIECDNDSIAECYLSAIMCKYWNLIGSFYSRQGIKQATEIDCYDWLVIGITKALRQKSWLKENNVLYNDPIGPEKAMTVCIMSTRANFYQAIKHQKRCLNYNSYSIEQCEENYSDGYLLQYYDDYTKMERDSLKTLIQNLFKTFDFYVAIAVDLIYTSDQFVDVHDLRKQILNLNDQYIDYFSKFYEINELLVLTAVKELKQLTNKNLNVILKQSKSKILDLL